MPWIILTLVTLPQKQFFISANDIVVAIRLAFISLYSIQGLKTQHKHRVLPLHRIEMDWDNISRLLVIEDLTGWLFSASTSSCSCDYLKTPATLLVSLRLVVILMRLAIRGFLA